MSIETEITRISTNVSDTLSAVSEMGGEVPEGATSNDMAAGVRSIPVGAKIDDTTPSSTTTYSSQKIESELNALNQANAAQDAAIEALGGSVHKRTNVMIIAHRGWHETAAQNTIEAFIDAVKNGFKWLEIDIRKTADNVYVMAHDATVTLYNNGTAQSVTIASANYADIKDMTWDAAGSYKISTLAGVFGAMRGYDVKLVCDRKSGSNVDIVRLAAHSGMIDKIMLSYASASAAIAEKALLLKYDHVPIRFIPSDPANIETLRSAVNNPIYADINASGSDGYIKTALAYDIPIVFAGCTASNKAMWQVLAAGCMANLNDNLSYDDFADMVTIDYTDTTTITGNSVVTVAPNETKTVSFTSSLGTPAGYIYAYMLDTTYASMKQKTFGSSVNIEITGKANGSAEVILFCGNGTAKSVSVSVSGEGGESGDITDVKTVFLLHTTLDEIGLSHTDLQKPRMVYLAEGDWAVFPVINGTLDGYYSPIPIPKGATRITLTCPGLYGGMSFWDVSSGSLVRTLDRGWSTLGGWTHDISSDDADKYFAIAFKKSDNTAFEDAYDTSGISVTFSY